MHPKVKTELYHLQKEGVISPVEFSDWACQIVPVLNSDESVRICGDDITRINKYSKDHSPLHKADYLFTTLSGGKVLSHLELESALTQMVVVSYATCCCWLHHC